MKCICCEKELEPVSDSSVMQPYNGGEVRVSFHYGSRFDWLGSRTPIRDDELNIVAHEPRQGVLERENRAERLSGCSHILAVLCDDCFEAKSHLFSGYEKTESELNKVVE